MSMNKNNQVMIAIFNDNEVADQTIEHLKDWDRSHDDYSLGAIGKIYKENGEIKSVVPHKTKGWAALGGVLGIIVGVLSGGIGLVAGAAGGGLFGGVAGSFFKKSLNMTPEEIASLGPELDAGKIVVVVTCDDYEMKAVDSHLQYFGGVVRSYTVPVEAINEAANVVMEADALMGLSDSSTPDN